VRVAVPVSILLDPIFATGREPLARAFSVDEGVIAALEAAPRRRGLNGAAGRRRSTMLRA